jgi:hypothetical protein
MKTIISSAGCSTHPHHDPSFEVTVPMTIQGVDLVYEIQSLTKTIGILTERLLRLEQGISPTLPAVSKEVIAKVIATPPPEPVAAPAAPVEVSVEQSTVAVVEETVDAVKTAVAPIGKKSRNS